MSDESEDPDNELVRRQIEAGTMLRRSLIDTINRCSDESSLTCYQVVGVLESIKHQMLAKEERDATEDTP